MQTNKVKGRLSPSEGIEINKSSIQYDWILPQGRWLRTLLVWKNEAHLIDQLLSYSLIGEDELTHLHRLHQELKQFIEDDLCTLENEINKVMKDYHFARSNQIVIQLEFHLHQVSETYSLLRIKIIEEITKSYPAKMI